MAAMWIMVAGPYRAGSADAATRAANLAVLNAAALAVWEKGHVPVIGVNMALPMIAAAGEAHYDALMAPVSLALAERCDAVLRIGGGVYVEDLGSAAGTFVGGTQVFAAEE